jgi:hypothetical protein
MTSIAYIILAVFVILSSVLANKENKIIQKTLVFAYGSIVLYLSKSGFESSEIGNKVTLLLFSIFAIQLILSHFLNGKIALIANILLTLSLFILFGEKVKYDEYELSFTHKDVLILPLIALFFVYAGKFKGMLLEKLFPIQQAYSREIISTLSLGLFALIASIFGGNYGLILIAIIYTSSHFYGESDFRSSIALLTLSILNHLVFQLEIELPTLNSAAVFLGLFVGIGSVLWINMYDDEKVKTSMFGKITQLLVPMFLIVAFFGLDKVKEHLGGSSAIFAILIAFALTASFVKANYQTHYLSISVFALLILTTTPKFYPKMDDLIPVNEKLKSVQVNNEKQEKPDLFAIEGKDLSEIIGKWKINTKESKVRFELGPKTARTKGYFSEISGKISIQDDIEASTFSIQLPVKSLSTFNNYRDESLMSAEFFNEAKFPSISINTKRLKQEGDKAYLVGTIEMMGVKKTLKLS